MAIFNFTELVSDPLPRIISAALGVDADTDLDENDVGKIVKLAASNNYILAATTNEIEGFVKAIDPATVNDGWGFGSVQVNGRFVAEVGANVATVVVVGDLVVADTQAAVNTAGLPQVIVGTPSTFMWRCIRNIDGTGVAGDKVLLERA